MKTYLPTLPEVSRETLAILAGAVLASIIIGRLPGLRAWMRLQWGGALPDVH